LVINIQRKVVPVRTILILAAAAFLTIPSIAHADGPPQEWELLQNDPNPFCGTTVIDFAAPEQADIGLYVWNPDSSDVARTLLEGLINAGYYRIEWDQLDDNGIVVPSGDYPYQLLALHPETEGVLFEAWLVATVECDPTATVAEPWGRIKRGFVIER
jgi:hypothetical protein